jgi:uncharacterized protein (TIGR02996 family)
MSSPVTPEAALKEAVRENPLDAGARLVYADGLEERGRNGAAQGQREKAARVRVRVMANFQGLDGGLFDEGASYDCGGRTSGKYPGHFGRAWQTGTAS